MKGIRGKDAFRIGSHFLFWLIFCLGNWKMNNTSDNFWTFLSFYTVALGFPIVYFYIHVYILKRLQYVKKHKRLKTVLFSFFALFISALLLESLIYLDEIVKKYFNIEIAVDPFNLFEYLLNLAFMGVIILGASFYFLINIYFKQKNKIEKLNQQQFRYQVQPHFLNNELQNLYNYIKNNEKENGLNYVYNLADIINYNIEASNSQTIEIQKEIKHLFNYLDLIADQWNLHNRIHYSFEGNSRNNLLIQPLILIYFVENSIKHSGVLDQEDKSFVNLELKIEANNFIFNLVNSIPKNSKKIPSTTQVGVRNAKELLKLVYGNNHLLKIKEDLNTYTVFLSITL
jgi:hypothetical protein